MTNSRIDILFKTITLLYRESVLEVNADDSSNDLARTIVATFNTNAKTNQLIGGESSIVDDLIYLVEDLINNVDGYDADTLTQSLEVILKEKLELAASITKSILADMGQPALKRSVLTLRNRLNNYYKEFELKSMISKASYSVNTGNLGGVSLLDFAEALATNIEALTYTTNKTKDPGIVDEFDITSEVVSALFNKVVGDNNTDNLLKVAWEELNDMMQGGFKRGHLVIVEALQHSYKSGLLRTILAQMLMCNTPIMDDPTKKPLMVLISYEDDADVIVDFYYRYLYYSEHGELPNMDEVKPTEAAKYVKDKLTIKGYNVKILRINPSDYSYKQMFNLVMRYEADGYEIHGVVCDYLAKLPTVGCVQGATGTDIRDMFNRTRNFFSA